MKKKIIIIFVLVLATLTGGAQEKTESHVNPTTALLGSWSGKLNVGAASLTLVLNLEQADGYVKVSLDSPDQGAKGIPASKEYLSDDSLAVKVAQIGMTYRARLKDGKLDGTFSQNGFSSSLILAKGAAPEVKRPQTPKPPYPYITDEVMFRNNTDGATLAGTLTWPVDYDKQSKQKPVVVLLVSGSGQQNRDEELFEHKPFLVIADYLARQGIATLRYDDRATGASVDGEVKNATTEDFARDAAAGLEYLRNSKAFAKVGLLGHSEGGSIYYKVLSEGNLSSAQPTLRSIITAHYTGKSIDGKQFDSSRGGVPLACRLCDLIEDWIIAMQQMHIGDKWEIYIPAEMGYGKFFVGQSGRAERSQPGIPGGSTLIFEIELLGIACYGTANRNYTDS